jgi:pyridoxine/pyridoxamine 5'-phosphate oxidase
MSGMLGAGAQAPNEEQLLGKLEVMKATIEEVNRQFQDPVIFSPPQFYLFIVLLLSVPFERPI